MKTQVENAILKYWEETSKHLFIIEGTKNFLKFVLYKDKNDNNKQYVLRITFDGTISSIEKIEILNLLYDTECLIKQEKIHSAINYEKHFQKHLYDWKGKKISIKNFKLAKEAFKTIEALFEQNLEYKDLINQINGILKDIKFKE